MADNHIPYLQNEEGLAEIKVASRKFMCIGAMPPLDHPHVYLEMGDEDAIVCPYCGTVYRYDDKLEHDASPASCLYAASNLG